MNSLQLPRVAIDTLANDATAKNYPESIELLRLMYSKRTTAKQKTRLKYLLNNLDTVQIIAGNAQLIIPGEHSQWQRYQMYVETMSGIYPIHAIIRLPELPDDTSDTALFLSEAEYLARYDMLAKKSGEPAIEVDMPEGEADA